MLWHWNLSGALSCLCSPPQHGSIDIPCSHSPFSFSSLPLALSLSLSCCSAQISHASGMVYFIYVGISHAMKDTGEKRKETIYALIITQLQWMTLIGMYYTDIIEQEKQLTSTNELLFAHAEQVLQSTTEEELRKKYNAPKSASADSLSKMASRDIAVEFLKSLVVLDEIDVRKICVKKLRDVKALKKGIKDDASKKRIDNENKVPFTFFEGARWGEDTTLDKPPECGERFDWIVEFYKLVDDPQLQVVAKRLKILERAGGLLIIALEVYGLLSMAADNKATAAAGGIAGNM